MNKFLTTTALTAGLLTAGAGLAQDAGGLFRADVAPTEIYGSEFIGMNVYAAETADEWNSGAAGVQTEWEDVGEINDIILERDGSVSAVLVDIGGFLGIGERQVAMNMSQIRFVSDSETDDEDDFFLVVPGTAADFEEAPEYSMMGGTMETDAEATAPEMDAEADVETDADMADADTTAPAMGEDTDAEMAETEGTAPAMGADTDAEMTDADTTAPGMDGEMEAEYETVDFAELTAEDLDGARVYDPEDEWVGEISQINLAEDGAISNVIVDIGGFLGLGEKPVSLDIMELDIRRTGADEIAVYVPMTEDELEALPEYTE